MTALGGTVCAMSTIPLQAEIEDRFLRLLDERGLPLPDRSMWGARDVSFVWEHANLVVIVDRDDRDQMEAQADELDLLPIMGPKR